MAPNVYSSQNGAERLQKTREDLILEVTPKNHLHDLSGRKSVGNVAQKLLGKFGKIGAKILRTPKNLPVPTPMQSSSLLAAVT